MSGFGVICNCCDPDANKYNVCSFEPDGDLRWAVRWSAIDGASAGGMDVVGYLDSTVFAYGMMPAIHCLDNTDLVAVGEKDGTIHVAALDITDGSESIALTDTGEDVPDYWKTMTCLPFAHHRVVSNEIILAGLRNISGNSYYLERYAIDSTGSITVSQSNACNDVALPTSSASMATVVVIHPSGLVSMVWRTGGATDPVACVTVDSSGETARDDKTPTNLAVYNNLGSTGSEYIYNLADYDFSSPADPRWWRWDASPTTPPTDISGSLTNTDNFNLDQAFLPGAIDADHTWEVDQGVNVRYMDLANDTVEQNINAWNGISGITVGNSRTGGMDLGSDNLLWLGAFDAVADECWPVAVKTDGTVYQPTQKFFDFDLAGRPSSGRYPHIYSAAAAEALATVCVTDGTSAAGTYKAGLLSVSGSDLLEDWHWTGAPGALYTTDSSGNYYCANYNGGNVIDKDDLLRHEFLDLTSTVSNQWDVPSPSGLDKTIRYDSTPSATTPISTVPPDRNTAQEWNLGTVSATYTDGTITATVRVYVGVADESATLDAQLFVDGAWTTAVELSWTSGSPGWVSAVLASNLSNADFSSHKLRLTTSDPIGIEEFEAIYVELTGRQ